MLQSQSQSSLPFERMDEWHGHSPAAAVALPRLTLPAEPAAWDEMRQADGLLRPAWQRFAELLPPPAAGLTLAADLDRRVAQLAAQIRQDGVTHNVFQGSAAGGGSSARPWALELLPLIIEPDEWAVIERGVVQRARLLELLVRDVYGPQRMLHQGVLPAALVMRHPGYIRALRGVAPPGGALGRHLFIIAFDLVRGPDGRWWVAARRTQGPSGLGYVLHNRILIARQFPDAFRDMRVQHIASGYRRLLDTLEAQAGLLAGHASPRVVLLTPGRFSETYFEHTYLARYLGLPLVEGGDLTVRDDRVFLKTLEGLEPVHGILRRIDDDWCDPLELRPDSTLGVPGLLQAVRAGRVVMANALGSAFLESPAIQGFMPGIARRLMGEELLLPALPTWWCGEAAAWADVREQLHDKVVRSTFPGAGRTSRVRRQTDADIDADPGAWTVQARINFSRAPVWGQGVIAPRPAMVRVYAIADPQGAWHVLPGGMTRAAVGDELSVSLQRGGTSLDTWVLTDGPVDLFTMVPPPLTVADIEARRRPVSSRTAENLFWLGRYTERTEQMVRLARCTLGLLVADDDPQPELQQALSELCVANGLAPAGVPTLAQGAHLFERALLADLGDDAGATSIAFNLLALERAAQALRERLSGEQWSLVRSMRESFAAALEVAPGELPSPAQVLPALDRLALQLAAVTGMQNDRMTRDHGWRMMAVGRLVERLIGVSTRLAAFLDARAWARPAGAELLLELFDSAITFRARYQRHDGLLALADLLVLDPSNPRAFAGTLRRLRTELSKLPAEPEVLAALAGLIPAEGAGIGLAELRELDERGTAIALARVSARLAASAAKLADDVGHRFFAHAHDAERLQRV